MPFGPGRAHRSPRGRAQWETLGRCSRDPPDLLELQELGEGLRGRSTGLVLEDAVGRAVEQLGIFAVVLLLLLLLLMMMTPRFIQAEIVRVAEAELALPYRRRSDDGPMRLRFSAGHPVVVRERVTGTPRFDARVVRRRFLAFFEVGEADGRGGGDLSGRRGLGSLQRGLVQVRAVTLAAGRLTRLVHRRKIPAKKR